MIATTEVDRNALLAQLCPVFGSRHLRGDLRRVLVRHAPVVDRLQRQGGRR